MERELGKINEEEIINAMIKGFKKTMKIEFCEGKFDKKELKMAEKLRRKYESKEWNFKR